MTLRDFDHTILFNTGFITVESHAKSEYQVVKHCARKYCKNTKSALIMYKNKKNVNRFIKTHKYSSFVVN